MKHPFRNATPAASIAMKHRKFKTRRVSHFGLAGFGAACALAGSIAHAQFTYTPLTLTASSWTQDMVVEAGSTNFNNSVTATMDGGTNKAGNTWYEQGLDPNAGATGTGLPVPGLFTSAASAATEYLLQSYTGNNAVLLNGSTLQSATLTLSTPTAVTGLSFLTADGNGGQNVSVTINYADGTQSVSGLSFNSPDWFGGTNVAFDAEGRVASGAPFTFNNVNSGNPSLYEEDLTLPAAALGHAISSITLTFPVGVSSVDSIFALSASGQTPVGQVIWDGQVGGTNNGAWDTSTQNWKGPTNFLGGDSALFDDTATGTTNVTATAAGVFPSSVIFANNTKNYAVSGGSIGAGASLTLNGTGMVTLSSANTYTGGTVVNAGTLVVGSSGTLGTGPLAVNNTNAGAGTNVVVDFNSAQSIGALSGTVATSSSGANTATINLDGNLTINQTGASTYAGVITGPGGLIYSGSANRVLNAHRRPIRTAGPTIDQ